MHIALLAGEASGDQLGAELIKALRKRNPCIRFDGVGGEKMQAQGFNSLIPMEEFSVMGISEVLWRLPKLLRYRNQLIEQYQSSLPNAFIGIDSPDFNLRLAGRLREIGIYTAQYVSPSVWAWRENRIETIKRSCDLMLTLFEFEKQFYDKHQMPAVYCGHPLVDLIPAELNPAKAKARLQHEPGRPYLAVLPGSRQSEVRKMLPVFIQTARYLQKKLPNLVLQVPVVNQEIRALATKLFAQQGSGLTFELIDGDAKQVMLACDSVLLASGTATLEAMLLQKPMVVAYKVSRVTATIAKRLVNVTHFSLPNLLADHPVVPEFIQDAINHHEMAHELYQQITDASHRNALVARLVQIRRKVRGHAAENAAKAVYQDMMRKELMG